jgi:hypothetical protein
MARTNLQIKVGTYTGDGNDSRIITGVGFEPKLLIVKGGANIAVWRVEQNRGDSSMYFAGNTANAADFIQAFTNDGFVVGTDAKVNANATVYYYIAFNGTAAQQYFKTGNYIGNNTDARQLTSSGITFTPDIFFVKGDTAQNPSTRTAEVTGDNSWHFAGVADATNEIQNLVANGVELGNSPRTNGSGLEYFFASFKKYRGVIASGTYVGNGIDTRTITGLGFQPDFVLVKDGLTTYAACIRTSDFVGDSSASVGSAGPTTNQIESFTSDGFTVGTSGVVNAVGDTFWWIAFKAGNFNLPLTRTTS